MKHHLSIHRRFNPQDTSKYIGCNIKNHENVLVYICFLSPLRWWLAPPVSVANPHQDVAMPFYSTEAGSCCCPSLRHPIVANEHEPRHLQIHVGSTVFLQVPPMPMSAESGRELHGKDAPPPQSNRGAARSSHDSTTRRRWAASLRQPLRTCVGEKWEKGSQDMWNECPIFSYPSDARWVAFLRKHTG